MLYVEGEAIAHVYANISDQFDFSTLVPRVFEFTGISHDSPKLKAQKEEKRRAWDSHRQKQSR